MNDESMMRLQRLCEWMRKVGACRVTVGDMTLELSSEPASESVGQPAPEMTPEQVEAIVAEARSRYEDLLFASSEGAQIT